jgi:hypothetical protein
MWIQHFYGWSGITGFVHNSPTQDERVIRYRLSDDIYYQISENLELGIGISTEAHTEVAKQSIKEDAWISFRSPEGLSFVRCMDLLAAVRQLLHFAVLERIYPAKICADKKGHGYHVGDHWRSHKIEIWSTILRKQKTELPLDDRWVFRFKDLSNRFAEFFKKWLEYVDSYKEALGCYSSTIYHSLTHEMTLLSLTQALDAYHGQKFESHQTRDFKTKIRELATPHAEVLQGLIDDMDAFVEQVHVNRNYYTHHNPKWKETGKVVEKGDLYRLNEKIKLIFQMCVLTDIGIPATSIM